MKDSLENSDKPKAPANGQGFDKPYKGKTAQFTVPAARQEHKPTVNERPEHTKETLRKSHMENKSEQNETLKMIHYPNSSSNFAGVKIAVVSESHFKTNSAHDKELIEAQKQENYESTKQYQQHILISEESETSSATDTDNDSSSPTKYYIQNSITSRSETSVSKGIESKMSSSKASSLTNHSIEKLQINPNGYIPALRKGSKSSVYTQSDLMSYDGSISPYRQIMRILAPSAANSELKTPVSSRGVKIEPKTDMQLRYMMNRFLEKELKSPEMKVTSDSTNKKKRKKKKKKKKKKQSSNMSLNQITTPHEPIFISPKQTMPSPRQNFQTDGIIYSEVNFNKSYHDPSLKNTVNNLETACTKTYGTKTANGMDHNDCHSNVYTNEYDTKTSNGIYHNDGQSHEHNDLVNEFNKTCNVKLTNQQKLPNLVPNKTSDSVIDHYSEHPMKLDHRWRKHAPNETKPFEANVKMTNLQDSHVHFKVTSDDCANVRIIPGYSEQEKKKLSLNHQGRSKPRKRKRSTSQERKPKQTTGAGGKVIKNTTIRKSEGHLRLPAIDKNDKTVSHAKAAPMVQHKRTIDFDEMETETLGSVTPSEKKGAAKWKALVQKYMRETSPVVGKTENRLLLQTQYDSDSDDSVSDIFERARRKYALDIDDDDDDSDY